MIRSYVLFFCCVGLCVALSLKDFRRKDQPSKDCGPNAVYNCVKPCPLEDICLNPKSVFCLEDVIVPCEYRCSCKEGFIKTEGGECIPTEDCPRPLCSETEMHVDCRKTCLNETCAAVNGHPLTQYYNDCETTEPCVPGCRCKYAHARKNDDSPCVSMWECAFL